MLSAHNFALSIVKIFLFAWERAHVSFCPDLHDAVIDFLRKIFAARANYYWLLCYATLWHLKEPHVERVGKAAGALCESKWIICRECQQKCQNRVIDFGRYAILLDIFQKCWKVIICGCAITTIEMWNLCIYVQGFGVRCLLICPWNYLMKIFYWQFCYTCVRLKISPKSYHYI